MRVIKWSSDVFAMQMGTVPGLWELIEGQLALVFGVGKLVFGTGWLLRRLQRRTGAMPSAPSNRPLLFYDYRDFLTGREEEIRQAIPSAVGDPLTLLKAELAAVEDGLANLANSFFVLKSELAQASTALTSMQSHASRFEIIGARKALNAGDTRRAELIFGRIAAARTDVGQTVEAYYRLGRLALANIDYGKGLAYLRQASELASYDLRVNASLAELVDILVTLVDTEPLPPATLGVL